jgi:capsular polysaccharide biosynthesis protein
MSRAVRHHLALVVCFAALGGVLGWTYLSSAPRTWTSLASVLVNPSSGNPYSTTPESVRQDEMTSLETEAQVARSAEVLGAVSQTVGMTTTELQKGLQVTVPPNTQVLEIAYTATDPAVAQEVADAVANAYLDNRDRRFMEVNAARIERVENRTTAVVRDLRAATAAAQTDVRAERLFQRQLADALSNELVSLRAQRTSLENSEAPAGTVIAPASEPKNAWDLATLVFPVGGALAGLGLGCLVAVLLERVAGRTRSPAEVEAAGLPVIAAVPSPRRRLLPFRRTGIEEFDTSVRRLRATILDIEPRPEVIAVAPAGRGPSDADVCEALAESFAKAGHRVVLVQTDGPRPTGGLAVDERGLAQALLHERLNVLDMLQPSVEPLLCLLPHGGFNAQSRELLAADRLREVLTPLVEAGHLVIIQSPGIDSAEGEAVVGAADLGLLLVTTGRTRPREIEQAAGRRPMKRASLQALVVPRHAALRARRTTRPAVEPGEPVVVAVDDTREKSKVKRARESQEAPEGGSERSPAKRWPR